MKKRPYEWRRLTGEERARVMAGRLERKVPWHSPPRRLSYGSCRFHVTAACFEHLPWIGESEGRMEAFSEGLLAACDKAGVEVYAWCVLPNHYHLLVRARDVRGFLRALGRLHGGTSYRWNLEDGKPGRKVFFRAVEREMRGEGHFFASLNYIHHNPVRHGYVGRWQEWPWGSAREFLARVGRVEAERIWRAYPVDKYGEGWDSAET